MKNKTLKVIRKDDIVSYNGRYTLVITNRTNKERICFLKNKYDICSVCTYLNDEMFNESLNTLKLDDTYRNFEYKQLSEFEYIRRQIYKKRIKKNSIEYITLKNKRTIK